MLPDTPQLEAFVALASLLHFGKAAEQLHLTQSTVSHRILTLEQTLGVQLFDRSHKRVRLTPAGAAYQRRITAALRELRRAELDAREAASGQLGRLVIACSGALSASPLMDALEGVLRASPGVRVELQQRGQPEQLAALAAGEIDVGCTFLPLPDRPGLASLLLPRPLYAWVGPRHPLRRATTRDALQTERWVILSERAEAGFARWLARPGLPVPIEVDALDAAFALVQRDLAVTITPDTSVAPRGVRRLSLEPEAVAQIRVFWDERSQDPVLRSFVEALGETG
jgi:DNA-binding transcriptional LysR family regulator